MTRYVWIAYFAVVALFAIAPSGVWLVLHFGPMVEWRLAPITGEQSISPASVEQLADGRLCWTRWTEKLRKAEPWNYDVFLDRPWLGDRTFPEVSNRDDGQSWHTKGALPVGRHPQNQCLHLPALAPGEPIVVSQTIHYAGWNGWWDLLVPVTPIHYTAPP